MAVKHVVAAVRLTRKQAAWLRRTAKETKLTRSAVLVRLIEMEADREHQHNIDMMSSDDD